MGEKINKTPVRSQPMKVVMLTEYPYIPEDERLGGIMQASFRLVNALNEMNDPRMELYIVTQSGRIQERVVKKDRNVTIIYYPEKIKWSDPLFFGYPSVEYLLHQVIMEISPDLLHGQGKAKYIYAVTHSHIPHIVTIHGIYRNEMKVVKSKLSLSGNIKKFIKIELERYYVSKIKNLIAITNEVSSFVRRQKGGVRIFNINNTIDSDFFQILPLPQDQPPIILFVAAITYRKGLDYLLEAFTEVNRIIPEAQLRIAGIWDWDPLYVEKLKEEYSNDIASGKVIFLGGISQKQLIEEMSRSSLLCLPSRAESAPMVISQAMAAGRPVIASRVGGIPQMIEDGITGFLFDVGDVKTLSNLIIKTLTNWQQARIMGNRARELATELYSARSVAEKTVRAYIDVLNPK